MVRFLCLCRCCLTKIFCTAKGRPDLVGLVLHYRHRLPLHSQPCSHTTCRGRLDTLRPGALLPPPVPCAPRDGLARPAGNCVWKCVRVPAHSCTSSFYFRLAFGPHPFSLPVIPPLMALLATSPSLSSCVIVIHEKLIYGLFCSSSLRNSFPDHHHLATTYAHFSSTHHTNHGANAIADVELGLRRPRDLRPRSVRLSVRLLAHKLKQEGDSLVSICLCSLARMFHLHLLHLRMCTRCG